MTRPSYVLRVLPSSVGDYENPKAKKKKIASNSFVIYDRSATPSPPIRSARTFHAYSRRRRRRRKKDIKRGARRVGNEREKKKKTTQTNAGKENENEKKKCTLTVNIRGYEIIIKTLSRRSSSKIIKTKTSARAFSGLPRYVFNCSSTGRSIYRIRHSLSQKVLTFSFFFLFPNFPFRDYK